jgi:nitroimidazol reductase NimA-like FMN-containing flavoprotein (pyridoxamine 5'-phosphate oxidase superfamily)
MASSKHTTSIDPDTVGGLDPRDLCFDILDENQVMAIGTIRSDGWPHVTQVNYLRLDHALYFVVARDSQKFANIDRDPRVSIALGGTQSPRGLSIAARAMEVRDSQRIKQLNHAMHERSKSAAFTPHPSSPLVAIMEAKPEIISLVDYTKPPGARRLMRVIEDWRLEPVTT